MELQRKKKILKSLVDDVIDIELFKKLKKVSDEELFELQNDGSIEMVSGYVRLTKIADYHLKTDLG